MVTELQFGVIAAFLLWCLISSLSGVLDPDPDEARLVWRDRGPAGWSKWREVHFGLTRADRRVLTQPESALDRAACAALRDTVMHQARHPDSEAIQFAVVRLPPDSAQATAIFVSHHIAVASARPSIDPSLEAQAT